METAFAYSTKKPKVYISGAISRRDWREVVEEFDNGYHHLLSRGYEPVNPLYNGLPREATWGEHMLVDLSILSTCDAIMPLPSWVHSRGAKIEMQFAKGLGLKVIVPSGNDIGIDPTELASQIIEL